MPYKIVKNWQFEKTEQKYCHSSNLQCSPVADVAADVSSTKVARLSSACYDCDVEILEEIIWQWIMWTKQVAVDTYMFDTNVRFTLEQLHNYYLIPGYETNMAFYNYMGQIGHMGNRFTGLKYITWITGSQGSNMYMGQICHMGQICPWVKYVTWVKWSHNSNRTY